MRSTSACCLAAALVLGGCAQTENTPVSPTAETGRSTIYGGHGRESFRDLDIVLLPPCDTVTPPDTLPTDTIPTDTIPSDTSSPPTLVSPSGGFQHGGGNWWGGHHGDRKHHDECSSSHRKHRRHRDRLHREFPDSSGFIKLTQPRDLELVVFLETFVHHLTANNVYLLQAAADTELDGQCSSEDWATIGPLSIVTNDRGNARTELFQDVSGAPVGTAVDVHFQVIDSTSTDVALESKCVRFVTRQ